MATTFLDSLKAQVNKNARTENNALTYSSSGNDVLNFFALAGAKRNDVNGAIQLFRAAYAEDRQLAVRALFYLRDIRGGQGERNLFRALFKELQKLDDQTAKKIIKFIPEYGRWDDVFASVNNGFEIVSMVEAQLRRDEDAMKEGHQVSLMAKWLPSENTSSSKSRALARLLASGLDISNKEYRKRVVALRKYIQLLEQKMSTNQWSEIDYGKLPSQAGRKHTKAFKRHDELRYEQFLEQVVKGEKKLNAGTLYTYEVMDVVRGGNESAANAFWASLPDYTNGSNALVVADTSGSMSYFQNPGPPIVVSTSLALYFAEHNEGPFKNYFITFSENPHLVAVRGNTLSQKLQNISTTAWGFNTDISKVFELILNAAKRAGANAEDIPKVIYIISDMEFDSVRGGEDVTNYENAKQMFENAGFKLPHVVFWNVASRNTNVPATTADQNVTLVSGLSQSTFRYVMEGKTPMESMLDILNGDRYSQIVV